MGVQLLGCGDLLRGDASDTAPEQHRSAQPGRVENGAVASDSVPYICLPEASRQGAGITTRTDGSGGDTDTNPGVSPPPGWEAVRCSGAATRRISLAGNLDLMEAVLPPWRDGFTPEDPTTYTNFSATVAAFDNQGRQQNLNVSFARLDEGWDYHVVMDGTAFLVGDGRVSFDERGAHVATEVTQELRLLTSTSPGPSVELDLTGMTSRDEPNTFTGVTVDGGQARWGTSCVATPPMPAEAPVTGPQCPAAATTRASSYGPTWPQAAPSPASRSTHSLPTPSSPRC